MRIARRERFARPLVVSINTIPRLTLIIIFCPMNGIVPARLKIRVNRGETAGLALQAAPVQPSRNMAR